MRMSKPPVAVDLDDEDLADPEELVGDIQLHGSGAEICAESVYLDSWLVGLGEGLEVVKRGQPCEVELLEEAYPLRFQPSGGGFILSFRDLSAYFPSISEFEASLALAASEVLQRLAGLNVFRETQSMHALEALASRQGRKA
jgi:hypothetical protein